MPLQHNHTTGDLPGMRQHESWLLLGINWILLFCCLLTIYFGNPEDWSLWIFAGLVVPLLFVFTGLMERHFAEMLLQFGMTMSVMAAFFTGWAPPMVVLLFVSTGLMALVFLLRPWGGWYFVLMSMLVTIPIAVSMMGYYEQHTHHVYSKMAIIIATFLMNGANAYYIAKQNKATRAESVRARQLVNRMNEVHQQFASVIAHSPSLNEALWEVTGLCIPTLELEDCVIYLVDAPSNTLEQVAAYGPKSKTRGEILSPLKIPVGKGIVGSVAQSGKPLIVGNTRHLKTYIPDDKERQSELAVPIVFDGKVFGVIDSEHSEKHFFTEDHLALFKMIATLCANKIGELRLLYSEVEKTKAEKELSHINELEQLRNTFLNNLSHDLRTPLSLIKGPLQELQKMTHPDVKKLSDVAMRNAERLNEMVSGLLEMHRLERGALQPNLSDIDLSSRIREWFALFIHRAEQNGIDYQIVQVNFPVLHCDVEKIGQVVQNLLSNAFKFTPRDGHIHLHSKWESGELTLEVADSGPGIPETERHKIFDRFYKIDHDSHIEGTGLGLAMVMEFCELMGGSVEVNESRYGGALFKVVLPLPSATKESNVVIPVLSHLQSDKPLIVLIEDHPEMNAFIADLLETDYHVHTALNAEDGWELIAGYLPDLVITDLMLPGMSGEMLCKRVKTTLATDHLPVLALSAKQNTDTRIEMYAYGADNYLTKPFDADELLSVVAALIAQRSKLKEKFGGRVPITSGVRTEGMRRIDAVIATHIADTQFGPRDLEKAVGMSRNLLQRKIKAVTGHTPVEYIRISRLAHARNTLLKGEVNVSEAAYMSGFNQLAYFSKSYKAHYGISPSEELASTKPH